MTTASREVIVVVSINSAIAGEDIVAVASVVGMGLRRGTG